MTSKKPLMIVLIVPIVVIPLFWAAWKSRAKEPSRSLAQALKYAPLPDPIVERLGRDKALRIQFEGAAKHIADVRETYGHYADVRWQCGVAESMIADRTTFCAMAPVLLYASACEFGVGPRILIAGLSPNREPAHVVFTFAQGDSVFEIVYNTNISEKIEEFTTIVRLLPFRIAAVSELRAATCERAGNVSRVLLNHISDQAGGAAVLLPEDQHEPVYVAVIDRRGERSTAVLLHRR